MSNNETANREYKDALFKFIFGNENRKELTLSLFNAINDKDYDDPSAVQIVTLKDVLFINVHNDVAFILSDTLSLYEQQSTWNPNMPVRCLVYAAREYEYILIEIRLIHIQLDDSNCLHQDLHVFITVQRNIKH